MKTRPFFGNLSLPIFTEIAIFTLLPFRTTNLNELSFSVLTYIHNENRERLLLFEQEMRVDL